jgi:sporulation protein YlmC with PRC-barrel domain
MNAPTTVRLQELTGRVVVDAAGRRLGRVVDVVAEPWGDELRVTTLLVGPGAWAARFSSTGREGGRRVPWQEIAALTPCIVLRAVAAQESGGTAP